MKERAQEDKKITMLQKISYLFDRKQKMQFIGLGILILIGGLLETLGVSMMVPLVQGIMDPEALYQNEIVGKILRFLHIETADDYFHAGGADDSFRCQKCVSVVPDLCAEYFCHEKQEPDDKPRDAGISEQTL